MKLIEISLGEHATMRGFLHEPSPQMGNVKAFPAILVAPGGAFRVCAEREGEPVALAFFAEGYSAFVLDYTTTRKKQDATIEDPLADCTAALRYLRENAAALHLKSGRIAMLGFSAGGRLAAAAATGGPERPDLLLLGYAGLLQSPQRSMDSPDVIGHVDAQTPPTFLFATSDDPVVPPQHALAFAQALAAAGVEFELHIFRHGGHALSLGTALTSNGSAANIEPRYAQWLPLALQWMKEKWGDFTVYGLNDGRTGRFSVDSPIRDLMADENAAGIMTEFLPEIGGMMAQHPKLGDISIRAYQALDARGWNKPLSEEDMTAMDRALLAL